MKFTTKENSTNYTCNVVEIKDLFPIEGADRIQRAVVLGVDVVCSKDVKVGDKMLYFCSGTKLSDDYCKYNNLYERPENNLDTSKKGFINSKNRVRAIKLKGIISDGMLMSLNSLSYFVDNVGGLKIGDEFTDINDISICEKYFVPVRNFNVGGKAPKKLGNRIQDVIIENQFRFHSDTEHFVKHQNKFTQESEIIITRKIHGSSLILSNVLVNKKLNFKERLFNLFGANIPNSEYGIVWSSGKPKSKLPKGVESENNKWETPNPSFYSTDIWAKAYKEIGDKIEKGVSIYAEIVGKGIQGDMFTYNQEYGIYIYRITSTNVDGQVYEFSWEQLKEYCNKYGLNYVQEYFVGKVKELTILEESQDLLLYLQNRYLNKSYPDCKIDEGVCIRLRGSEEIFKLKSPNFIKMESDAQEKEETNLEDNQE
jgi:RNA ligase (TIGR02306 family)